MAMCAPSFDISTHKADCQHRCRSNLQQAACCSAICSFCPVLPIQRISHRQDHSHSPVLDEMGIAEQSKKNLRARPQLKQARLQHERDDVDLWRSPSMSAKKADCQSCTRQMFCPPAGACCKTVSGTFFTVVEEDCAKLAFDFATGTR